MTEAIKLERVLHAYRELLQYTVKGHPFFYNTEPFLVGVGCGGVSTSERFVDIAREAVNNGYKLRLQSTPNHQKKQYPLHPDDAAHIKTEFRAEDFI